MKFIVGDRVKVINYGHNIYETNINGSFVTKDICPEIVGQIGKISKAMQTQNISQYSIDGIPRKTSWYNDSQLELIHRVNNYNMDDITKESAILFFKSIKNEETGNEVPEVLYPEVQLNCQYEIVKGADFDIDKSIEI